MGYKPTAICPAVSISNSVDDRNSADAQHLVSAPFSTACPEEERLRILPMNSHLPQPRPQQQYEVDQYGSLYSARLLVKPGITGPWQIHGRNALSQEESEQLDITYVENWSFTGDIAIPLKTILAVFRGTGVRLCYRYSFPAYGVV